MMFPRTYSAPVPAPDRAPDAEPTLAAEPERAVPGAPALDRALDTVADAIVGAGRALDTAANGLRLFLWVAIPVCVLAYMNAPASPRARVAEDKPAPTVPRDSGAPEGIPYVVTKAGAYGCTAYPLTEQIEAAIALGTSLKEIATVRPELVAECVTLNVGETVTTAWSGREHPTLIRVRKAGERYVHWVPRRFLRKQAAATQ